MKRTPGGIFSHATPNRISRHVGIHRWRGNLHARSNPNEPWLPWPISRAMRSPGNVGVSEESRVASENRESDRSTGSDATGPNKDLELVGARGLSSGHSMNARKAMRDSGLLEMIA